jgi:hypothetical protein
MLQSELAQSHPHLDIQILGINDWALALGNESISEGRDIPWLQDVDSDQNGISDVWDQWDVTFRDVVILDGNGEKVEAFNLTVNNLSDPQNYGTLREMLVSAAVPEPSAIVLVGLGVIALALGRRRAS